MTLEDLRDSLEWRIPKDITESSEITAKLDGMAEIMRKRLEDINNDSGGADL